MALKKPRSTLDSVLGWFDRPFQVVGNALEGNFEGAARQAGDFLLDPVDALLPGDWLPELTRDEDVTSGRKLLGLSETDSLGTLADIGVGGALNPLSYVSFGANQGVKMLGKTVAAAGQTVDPLTLIGKGAGRIIDALPESAQAPINSAIMGTKSTLGWLKAKDPRVQEALTAASAARNNVSRSQSSAANDIFKGTTPSMQEDMFRVIQNTTKDPAGTYSQLSPSLVPGPGVTMEPIADQIARWQQRVDLLPADPVAKAAMKDTLGKYGGFSQSQFSEAINDFPAFSRPQGADLATSSPTDYAARNFSGIETDELVGLIGSSNPGKSRTLTSNEKLLDFQNSNPGVTLDENLASAALRRGEQQAQLASKATLGKSLADGFGGSFESLNDPKSREVVNDIITGLKTSDPEGHELVKHAWNGMTPRGPIMDVLAKVSAPFKKAVTFGLVFPRVGGHMRNILAFPTQLASQEGIPLAVAGGQVLRSPQTVLHAMREGVNKAFGISLPVDEIGRDFQLIEAAFTQSGGRASNALASLAAQGDEGKVLSEALRLGVVDSGFVKSEDILNSINSSSWGRKVMAKIGIKPAGQDRAIDIVDAPAAAWQGAEQYARLGAWKDLVKRGKTTDESAALVKEAMYDYTIQSDKNRTLRTVLPFAAFTTNAIRANAKLLSRQPKVATFLAGMQPSGDEPLLGHMEGRINIPIGRDEENNRQYISGTGLPIEALSTIPNLTGVGGISEMGREIERSIVASGQPLLKSVYAAIAGHDPYFGTPYGSYSKIPVIGEAGAAGRAYNQLAGTGLIAFLDAPLRTVNQMTDDRHGMPERLMNTFTGMNIQSVDDDRAIAQQLQSVLARDPTVGKKILPFAMDPNSESARVVEELREVQKRLKIKKQAAAAAAAASE